MDIESTLFHEQTDIQCICLVRDTIQPLHWTLCCWSSNCSVCQDRRPIWQGNIKQLRTCTVPAILCCNFFHRNWLSGLQTTMLKSWMCLSDLTLHNPGVQRHSIQLCRNASSLTGRETTSTPSRQLSSSQTCIAGLCKPVVTHSMWNAIDFGEQMSRYIHIVYTICIHADIAITFSFSGFRGSHRPNTPPSHDTCHNVPYPHDEADYDILRPDTTQPWNTATLNRILQTCLVSDRKGHNIHTFQTVEFEPDLYRWVMSARCYPFDMERHRFRGRNVKVYTYTWYMLCIYHV